MNLKTEYKCNFGRINPSPEIRMSLPDEVRKEVIKSYTDTYIYMRKEHPKVEKLWGNSYRLLE